MQLHALVGAPNGVLRTILTSWLPEDAVVDVAENGRDLFWQAVHAKLPVDIVVSELELDVYSALDVAEAWHALGNMPRMVLLAREVRIEDVQRARAAGATVVHRSCLPSVLACLEALAKDPKR